MHRGRPPAGGSPAHAGMDPRGGGPCRCPRRLPRTRGDGPDEKVFMRDKYRAPPHTRGWTVSSPRGDTGRGGSPAHAGMDLATVSTPAAPARLPRTRGDGPLYAGSSPHPSSAPPHTRGWTLLGALHQRGHRGSPAHAGMDPDTLGDPGSPGRLPRTRGDGPKLTTTRCRRRWAPPHTRGWTVVPRRVDEVSAGSPAHAGMDPRRTTTAGRPARLPRTRGDGPGAVAGAEKVDVAPPHTRGWTHPPPRRPRRYKGSPAHAGMDPSRSGASWAPVGLPRTRGDGPDRHVPRPRQRGAPPHTRGWTLGLATDADQAAGSPAHAGMDPPRS